MNKVMLIGNLTRDPELTTTNSGVSVCRFSLAVPRRFASSDNGPQADFFNIVVWRGQAEPCGRFLKKGSKNDGKINAKGEVKAGGDITF